MREIIPSNTTILGGTGDDTISLTSDAENNLIQYKSGEGNDTITGFNEDDTLSISGSYSTQESGADLLVKVGEGTITLKDVRTTTETININGETIELEKNITLTDGDDSVNNSRDNVTINALGGNDIISNSSNEVTIDGGAGNDTISLGYLTYGNLIKYTEGDGNDLIQGFGEYNTLKIAGSSYSTKKSGEDIVVTVGEGKITLVGAASLVTPDIVDEKPAWTLNDTTAQYGTADNTLVTVDGVKSLNGISLNKKVVTIKKAALGTDKVTVSDGYTLKLGSDVTKPSASKAAWKLSGSTATYNQKTSAGYILDDNAITYNKQSTKALVTVKGVKSISGLSVSGDTVTVKKASLGTSNVTVSDGYTLKLGSDVTKPSASKAAWKLSGSTATYNQKTSAGYILDDNAITYNKQSTKALVTVKGVKSISGLSVSGDTVTVKKASLGTSNVTVSDGYTLKLGSDVTKPSASKAAWKLSGSTATYNQKTSAGYILDDNAITYNKQSTKALVTVKGVKSISGLSVSGDTVTVKKASLGTSNVTVSDGYTLKLGSDVTKPSASKAAWKLSGSTATYNQTTSAGYTLDDDGKSVSYSKTTTKALAAVKGAKSVKGLSVSGEKITLKNSALKNKVTVSGAYEFDFASDYKQATISGSANGDTLTAHGLKVSINGGNGNDTIKIFGSANTVTGGAGNDSLVGDAGNDKLYGGTGDDILIGGAGNDSLWGDAGADNFIYSSGDGKDVIFGFDNNDTLTLDGLELTSGTYNKTKGELTLKVDSGSITLKDFSATTFNVNGSNYKISGSKLVKK